MTVDREFFQRVADSAMEKTLLEMELGGDVEFSSRDRELIYQAIRIGASEAVMQLVDAGAL